MSDSSDSNDMDDGNLARFIRAQEDVFEQVLEELQSGKKRSHWMWFIFPQIAGLGHSSTSKYYSLKGLQETQAYLRHPILGERLQECTNTVLAVDDRSALDIFGSIDALKFHSSMTLFAQAAGPKSPYQRAINKYFGGEQDSRTLEILSGMEGE